MSSLIFSSIIFFDNHRVEREDTGLAIWTSRLYSSDPYTFAPHESPSNVQQIHYGFGGRSILMKSNVLTLTLIIFFVLFPPLAIIAAEHSSPAGLQWQLRDDTGWSARYERLGIKGTIEDQVQILFVEVRDGEFLNDSVLEIFVSREGMIRARRLDGRSNRTCFYIGHIKNIPTIFDQALRVKDRVSEITGAYTCETDSKKGEWSGTIFW